MSESRRLVPSMRSSARAQASRALESASSEIFAARSVSAITVLGRSQRIGGDAAGALGGFDFVDQRAALLGKQRRCIVELGALGGHFGDAGFDGGDLRSRALLAVLPLVAFGEDRLHAAVGEFRLARQRLRLGAHLGGEAAMALDVGADGGKFGFGLKARRQLGQRRIGALMRGVGLAAVGGKAAMGFGQRRFARGVAVDLALGRGMAFARGIGLALRGAPGLAGGGLRARCHLQFGLGVFQRLPLGGGVGAGLLQFVLDIDQARAFGQAPRGAGRCVGGRHKAVPAPDVAFERHQPLAGLELRHQFRAALLGDDADLRQPARQFDRGFDMGGQRFDAGGQRRIVARYARHWSSASAPTDRRARRDRRRARRQAPFHSPW